MGRFHNILLDLDGTLTDSKPGIVNSIYYALDALGKDKQPELFYDPFLGPPLIESFQKICGLSESTAKEAVRLYRVYYTAQGMFENRLYDGVEAMLQQLHAAKKTVILATSKPQAYAEQILAHFHIDSYFAHVQGSDMDGRFAGKSRIIAHALSRLPAYSKFDTLMAGDRDLDILGAKANKIASVGAEYGYGAPGELEREAPDFLADDVFELQKICLL